MIALNCQTKAMRVSIVLKSVFQPNYVILVQYLVTYGSQKNAANWFHKTAKSQYVLELLHFFNGRVKAW